MKGRVFHIVDPDHTVRQSLGLLLKTMGSEATGFDHAESLLEALAANRVPEPDCVISELRLPGTQGLGLLNQLRKSRPAVQVILVSAWADVPTVNRALRAGALACLEKPWRELDLTDLLFEAGACHDRAMEQQRRYLEALARFRQLSDRERAVFAMVCEGRLNKQISSDLGIAERTVEAHRSKVITKCGVSSIPELVRMAVLLENNTPTVAAATAA